MKETLRYLLMIPFLYVVTFTAKAEIDTAKIAAGLRSHDRALHIKMDGFVIPISI